MTKKKYIMTSGLVGITKNGSVFTTHYNKNLGGHYLMFVATGLTVLAYPEWDERTLVNSTSDDLNIVKLWTINSLAEYDDLETVMKTRTPIYGEVRPAPVKQKVTAIDCSPSFESSAPPEIKVTTSIEIMLNDKPVDFNNLSETERGILSKLGIL